MLPPLPPTPESVRPPVDFVAKLMALPHSRRDPNAWRAMFLDMSLPMDDQVKAALVLDTASFSRRLLLPIVFRPLARLSMMAIQVLKVVWPSFLNNSRVLHKLISWGMQTFVSQEANYLIVRHFNVGTEIVTFIKGNLPFPVETDPLRPVEISDLEDDVFLRHDINLFNFVIDMNTELAARGGAFTPPERVGFDAITDGQFPIGHLPNGPLNFIDMASAIELYTPMYQLLLSDEDFWRATNSLQLDETVSLYVAAILKDASHVALVNNKHPLVPLSTLRAGYRLLLHGLAAETLHAWLRRCKRQAAAGHTEFGLKALG